MNVRFLTTEEVLHAHDRQIERYGGGTGMRDAGLLESALAQPQMSFGGEYAHPSLFEMAAAYLFHIVSNHPFVDGNKRTGLAAALTFLGRNGIFIRRGTDALFELTKSVACGELDKPAVAQRLEEIYDRFR